MLLGAILNVTANDMTLTLDDNSAAILHDDGTWGYAQFTVSDGSEEDLYITLDNNKTICLKTDKTWEYTTKKAPVKKSYKELPSFFVTGTATKPTLDIAVNTATQQALTKAVAKMTPYAKKSKVTQKYLLACLKNELGSSGTEVTYTPGWTAQAKITLDNLQVKKIIECVETQIDLAATTATDSTKSAGK
jgi:hypothetical protein